MIFALASDHAATHLKNVLAHYLLESGHTVHDLTPPHTPAEHYAAAADKVCRAVLTQGEAYGVLLCGSGQGSAMRANRYQGVRAALVNSDYMAEMARAHNNANILVLGERLTTPTLALRYLEVFINTPYEGGRHTPRVNAIDAPTA